LQDLAVSRDVI